MMTQVKLLAMTVGLTAIIWVYADQSTQGNASTLVTVKLIPANPNDVLPIVHSPGFRAATESGTARVRVDFVGPKAAIRRLTDDERGGALEFQVRIPDDWTSGRRSLNLADALNRTPAVRERGLYAASTSPGTLEVTIDRWTTATFTVQADAGPLVANLSGPIVVQPKSVTGRLRASHLEQLTTTDPVVIVPVQEWLRDAQGKVGPITIPLPRTIRDMPVEFQPGEVAITATLTQKTVSRRLSPIALSVMLNPDMMGQYKVVWGDAGDRIQAIDVRVPPDRAESLTPQNVHAFVAIGREDVAPKTGDGTAPGGSGAEGWVTRTVQFVFPPGYEDVRIEGPSPNVRLKVVEISSPTPAAVGAETTPR
jgi:hypothetical protein